MAAEAPDFNVLIFKRHPEIPTARMPVQAGYKLADCTGDYCLMRRPGTCRGTPMGRSASLPEGFALGPARYPQRQGIND